MNIEQTSEDEFKIISDVGEHVATIKIEEHNYLVLDSNFRHIAATCLNTYYQQKWKKEREQRG